MAIQTKTADSAKNQRYLLIAGLIVAVFFTSYAYANAKTGRSTVQDAFNSYGTPVGNDSATDPNAAGGAGCGGGCCGGGDTTPVEGATTVEGDVQRIDVDTSSGSFNPNVIKAKAGVPIEIAFSQAPGGCLSGVYFPDFNINEDLTAGGKTVKLPALEAGEYTFYCQMQMVSAKIVVE